jgi:NitT/TauT family transport system substrate-binding protein
VNNTRRKPWMIAVAALAIGSFVAAACGDDSSNGSAATTTAKATGTTVATSTTAAKPTVAGCATGYTDPADLSLTRKVARCDKNTPAPKPLATLTKVKMASSFKLEFNSPILLAASLGEFKKENIDFELVSLKFSDAVPQLASGTLDAATGGFESALFNAGNNNLPIRVVMGNYFPPDAGNYTVPQTGLWCRKDSFSNPADPTKVLGEIQNMRWASSVGKGSSAVYYSAAELKKRIPNFDITKVTVQTIPSNDTVTALKNKAIDCGVLLDPLWTQVKDDPGYFQAATQTPGEPLGIYVFGKSLLTDHPDVGEAFVRAVVRTVNTYYNGNYHQDATVMAEISKVTGQDLSSVKDFPSLTMDWEIRKDTTTRIQQLFIDLGVITDFKTPVAEDKLVDRSFYKKAVGAA